MEPMISGVAVTNTKVVLVISHARRNNLEKSSSRSTTEGVVPEPCGGAYRSPIRGWKSAVVIPREMTGADRGHITGQSPVHVMEVFVLLGSSPNSSYSHGMTSAPETSPGDAMPLLGATLGYSI